MNTYIKGRESYYDDLHNKNLPVFKELSKKLLKGLLKIIDIRIDEPEFGHRRVIIFFHEEE